MADEKPVQPPTPIESTENDEIETDDEEEDEEDVIDEPSGA